jgi:hypothetical protein
MDDLANIAPHDAERNPLVDAFETACAADRAFFAKYPKRNCYVRPPANGEGFGPAVRVYQLAPGVRVRQSQPLPWPNCVLLPTGYVRFPDGSTRHWTGHLSPELQQLWDAHTGPTIH